MKENDFPFSIGDELRPKSPPVYCVGVTEEINDLGPFEVEKIWFDREETMQFLLNFKHKNRAWRTDDFEKVPALVPQEHTAVIA
ncbi:MAG: hypothetical protein WCT19_03640 [Candidatus Paceibacterota bacterium]|jgi:hypothetical protein